METEKYIHHGAEVSVRAGLKGKHREHCLCYSCGRFKPGQDDNCNIANAVYKNCVEFSIVTPLWECPQYVAKD